MAFLRLLYVRYATSSERSPSISCAAKALPCILRYAATNRKFLWNSVHIWGHAGLDGMKTRYRCLNRAVAFSVCMCACSTLQQCYLWLSNKQLTSNMQSHMLYELYHPTPLWRDLHLDTLTDYCLIRLPTTMVGLDAISFSDILWVVFFQMLTFKGAVCIVKHNHIEGEFNLWIIFLIVILSSQDADRVVVLTYSSIFLCTLSVIFEHGCRLSHTSARKLEQTPRLGSAWFSLQRKMEASWVSWHRGSVWIFCHAMTIVTCLRNSSDWFNER